MMSRATDIVGRIGTSSGGRPVWGQQDRKIAKSRSKYSNLVMIGMRSADNSQMDWVGLVCKHCVNKMTTADWDEMMLRFPDGVALAKEIGGYVFKEEEEQWRREQDELGKSMAGEEQL